MWASESQDDTALLRSVAAGDVAALQQFLLRTRADLLRYLERRVPGAMRRLIEPQDVLQDTWTEVFRRRADLPTTSASSAHRWLLRIARARLIDLMRVHGAVKRGSEARVGGRLTYTSVVQLLADLALYERTPSQSAMAHEVVARVQDSIKLLSSDYQQAIRMRYMEGLCVSEVALRMGRSVRAVHMLCNRALRALRVEMFSASRYL